MSVKNKQIFEQLASITGVDGDAEPTLNGILYHYRKKGTTCTLTLTIASGIITVAAQT